MPSNSWLAITLQLLIELRDQARTASVEWRLFGVERDPKWGWPAAKGMRHAAQRVKRRIASLPAEAGRDTADRFAGKIRHVVAGHFLGVVERVFHQSRDTTVIAGPNQ